MNAAVIDASIEHAAVGTRSGIGAAGLALVADADATNRFVLRSRLELGGYRVAEAGDGAEAVERFESLRPDFVFMDVMMPNMDGIEATRRIKATCGDDFVPVIFLTTVSDDAVLADCLRAGGDDFLVEPYSQRILEGKLRAMGRIRDLHHRVRAHLARERRDQEIAQQVFAGAVDSGNLVNGAIRELSRPASTFSGDVVLSARAPSGDVHVLVGDFTGHGLAAALGALPASETFRAMTRKGFSIAQIRDAIDRKLASLLPTGMFMAAHIVAFDRTGRRLTAINCGMPEALLVDAAGRSIRHRLPSSGIALGVDPSAEPSTVEHVAVCEGDRIVLASDGVTEALGHAGERLGGERFEAALLDVGHGTTPFERIVEALDRFCGDVPLEDDVTLVEVAVGAVLLHEEPIPEPADDSPRRETERDGWEIAMTLCGPRLRDVDPVPLIMSQIQEFDAAPARRAPLYTVLTELYVNALDHGVLGLDSAMKAGADGFRRYLDERARRLARLDGGEVGIAVRATGERDGWLSIRVEDSGDGFDPGACAAPSDELAFHGRGLALVGELCESVVIEPPGNRVEVVFDGTA